MTNKPDSSRRDTFYILHVPPNYPDEEHPLSVSDICKWANEEFGYLSASGMMISTDTVKRILEELTDKIFIPGMDDEQQSPKKYYYESGLRTSEEEYRGKRA